MTINVDQLIADNKKAIASAEARKKQADKVAAALKSSTKANKDFKLQVEDKLSYANALATTIQDFENQLQTYAVKIARDGKLDPTSQADFDRILAQYKSTTKSYQDTVDEANGILAKAPSPTKVEVKSGKAVVAPTVEEKAATDLSNGKQPTQSTNGLLSVDQANAKLDELNKDPRAFIFGMSDQDRINLANTLTAAGYKTPALKGQFNDGLVANYKAAIAGAKAWNSANKSLTGYTPVDLTGFLTYRTGLVGAAGGSSGGSANGPYGQIYSATEAESTINQAVKNLLGRDATDQEITDLTKKLTDAQKANPYRKVNGMTVGGINPDQFVTDLIKKMPEYESKVAQKLGVTAQSIQSTAQANGLNFTPEQIDSYAQRVKNGEDITAVQNEIRTAASMGQPDSVKKLMQAGTDLETIYAPYKRAMATSLDLNPEDISLNDPTLRSAIGPDKEVTLYDFQKAIRKDSRWQYSQEANDQVDAMINQVKRDFGFAG